MLSMFGVRGSARLLPDFCQNLLQNIWFRSQRVQFLRVGNAEIPNNKGIEFALQYVHGIGRRRAHQILSELGIANKLTKDLTGVELNALREEVSNYLTGEDLKRRINSDVERLINVQCYRGSRHVHMLPCRGQRTHTNARTRKASRTFNKSTWDRNQALAERMRRHQSSK